MRSVLLVSLALVGCNGDPAVDTGRLLPEDAVVVTDADADGWPAEIDCDDNDPVVTSGTVFYVDADGDGFGEATTVVACELPEGHAEASGDCDDANPAVNPGATEVCNTIDDDCSGEVDGASATDSSTWYLDADGDGFGTTTQVLESCEQPDGYVSDSSDCDDLEAEAYPGNTEVCDGADNDCDGTTDGPDAVDKAIFYTDADGDGYGDNSSETEACAAPEGTVSQKGDCDDSDASLNPETVWFVDTDGDGYGTSDGITQCSIGDGYVQQDGDCDDGADDVYPGATEVCDDLDHNCDGKVDFDADDDGGSASSCGGSDCDDSDPELVQCGLTPESALRDCKAISDLGATEDGQYWIDPDDDGDTSNAIQVLCDMTTDGGGWTLTWAVDAEHFDGTFGNNTAVNPNAPTAYNAQQDVWNPPTDLPVSQVLYGCTNNSNEASYWRYDSELSLDFWTGTTDYTYQHTTPSDATSSSSIAGCFAAHKGDRSYGFMVIEEGDTACGYCQAMLWGTYHYPSGGECNNTDTSLGRHPSTVDGRSIGYPVCNKQQTSTGRFWIGVR